MKKKVLIIIGIVLLAIVALLTWFRSYTKSHSPAAKAEYHANETDIVVDYCRPYKKGRLIFGDEASGALQPYGKYWRVGANEATVFTASKDLTISGQPLKAGTYSIYAYPGKETWEVVFSSDVKRWGVPAPDAANDVMKVTLPANNNVPETEQFEIVFSQINDSTVNMLWTWDQTQVITPISIK